MNKLLTLFAFIICISCNTKHQNNLSENISDTSILDYKTLIKHSKLFTVENLNSSKKIYLFNPDNTSDTIAVYWFTNENAIHKSNNKTSIFKNKDLEKIAITTTTQLAYFDKLSAIERIKGVSEINHFKNKKFRTLYSKGEIAEFGALSSINSEILASLQAEIIFISLIDNIYSDKIKSMGINHALDLSYLEDNPLGRAEWIKFFAVFIGKEQEADSIFNEIEARYLNVKQKVQNIKRRPTLLTEKKYGQTWFLPGGNSYMANFYKDAGYDYLWKEDKSSGSIAVDIENVYLKGIKADFWIIKILSQHKYSYSELASESPLYKDFEAFKNKKILVCNLFYKPYYEDGVVEPDIILSDLVYYAHPNILSNYKPKYFELLKDQ